MAAFVMVGIGPSAKVRGQAQRPRQPISVARATLGELDVLAQGVRDALVNGQRIKQRRTLKRHGDAVADMEEASFVVQVSDALAIKDDLARIGSKQPNEQLQQHALAHPNGPMTRRSPRAAPRDRGGHFA